MQKLVFRNGIGNEIDLTAGNFGITNWEGLANVPLNIQTQQVPFEDGAVYLDALMEQREIAVTVAIYDGNNLELRYEKKRELISALNPKLGEGTLVYTNDFLSRQITAVPQIPLFRNKNSNDSGTLKASVAFTCPNPYWEDVEETVVEITNSVVQSIENNGDVEIGLNIDLQSFDEYSKVDKPYIYNITQNKKVEYDKKIGYIPLKINTNLGHKEVYKEAVDLENMKYSYINLQNQPMEVKIIYSEYYRKYFINVYDGTQQTCILKKSDDGLSWTDVLTSNYKQVCFCSNLILLYDNLQYDTGRKIKIGTDFEHFTEFAITVDDPPNNNIANFVCFPSPTQATVYIICLETSNKVYHSSFYVQESTGSITFGGTFTLDNLPDHSSSLFIYNPNLESLFCIMNGNCYKFTTVRTWELISEGQIYSYMPYGKYIKESNLMICYGSMYGYIYWSYDGITWESNLQQPYGRTIYDITFDASKGVYIAVGNYDSNLGIPFISETSDFLNWSELNGFEDLRHSLISQIIPDGMGYYLLKFYFEGYEDNLAITDLKPFKNEISNISKASNLSLGLLKGVNRIVISEKTKCTITYRQKYIGV